MGNLLGAFTFAVATLCVGGGAVAATDVAEMGLSLSSGAFRQVALPKRLTATDGALFYKTEPKDDAAAQSACTAQCETDFQDCFSTGVTYRVCMNERIQCIKDCARGGPAP